MANLLPAESYRRFDCVVIAASAGGMRALTQLFSALPPSFPAAIAAVHHLGAGFSCLDRALALRSALPVQWAEAGSPLFPGRILLAPPDRHLVVCPDRTVTLLHGDRVNYHRPCADLLFETAAGVFRDRTIGVVLSGMGRDGAVGARAIKNMGGRVLAQDQATSASFQMPLGAIETGAVDFVLSPANIAAALVALVTVPGAADLFCVSPHFALSHAQRHCHRAVTLPLPSA